MMLGTTQRIGLLLSLLLAAVVPAAADAAGSASRAPLQLELMLAENDWLLEHQATEFPAAQPPRTASRPYGLARERSGRGFRVGVVVPSLCEGGLPGNQVVDTYNSVMACDEDKLGVSVSVRNY